jgi:hypothetical protein
MLMPVPDRLTVSVLAFLAIVFLADIAGWGHSAALPIIAAALYLAGTTMSREAWRYVLHGMVIVSLAALTLALAQLPFMPRPRSLFLSANVFGAYAALHVFIALTQRSRLGNIAAIGNVAAVLLSQSRGAYLALGGGLCVWFWRKRPALVCTIAGCALLGVGILWLTRPTEDPRIGIWIAGLRVGNQRPILGWGQNGVMVAGLRHFFNIPLEWYINAGAAGLAAGGWLYAEGLLAAREHRAMLALLVAWAIQGCFLFGALSTDLTLIAALGYIGSEHRDVIRVPVAVVDDEPLLDGGVRAGRTD